MNESFLLPSFGGPSVPLHAATAGHYGAAPRAGGYASSMTAPVGVAPSCSNSNASAASASSGRRQPRRQEQDDWPMRDGGGGTGGAGGGTGGAGGGTYYQSAGRARGARLPSREGDLPSCESTPSYHSHPYPSPAYQSTSSYQAAAPARSTAAPALSQSEAGSLGARRSATGAPWVQSVLAHAGASRSASPRSQREATLLALEHVSSGRVDPSVLIAEDGIPSIVALLSDDSLMSKPGDMLGVISSLHVLASDYASRNSIVSSGGIESLTEFIIDSSIEPDAFAGNGKTNSGPSSKASSFQTRLPRSVWDAAVRTMAKLVVLSGTCCARAVECGGLSILAAAALPSEAIDTRIRAAAGIAAIASWSGPRHAVDVLQTRNVIAAMAGVLTDEDRRVQSHLRRATLDGLNVMAHRRRARLILKQSGCDEFISFAARQASLSGDHGTAARGTVVAGQMAGHSVDEFGFLVENGSNDAEKRDSTASNDDRPLRLADAGDKPGSSGSPAMRRQMTGLAVIQAELLEEEGFTLCEDIAKLEAFVDQGVGAFSLLDPAYQAQASGDGLLAGRGGDPDCDLSHVSPLTGFTAATERAAARGNAGTQKKSDVQLAQDARSESVWENVVANAPQDLEREHGESGRVRAYRDLAGVPIPSKLRAVVWPKLLDIDGLRARKPGLYDALCAHGEKDSLPEDIEHTIEADLTRTMPFHCIFWQSGAAPGIGPLRRVLRAYAFHVPSVGYCQGMSSIAALILLNSQTEEDAFLMLVRFLSLYGYKNVYKPGFPQYKEWVQELRSVIKARLPAMNALFEREGVMPELFLDKSIITCLTHNYPHRVLVRLWDLMFLGGSPKIILKACLAVLVLSEEKLMTMRFEEMVTYLQRGFADTGAGIVDDDHVEKFLEVTRSMKLSTEPVAPPKPTPRVSGATAAGARRQQAPTAQKTSSGLGACFPCFGGKRKDA